MFWGNIKWIKVQNSVCASLSLLFEPQCELLLKTPSLIKGYLVSGNVGWQHLTCPGSWRLPLMKVETRKQDEVKLGGWEGGKCQLLSPLFRLPLIATLLPRAAKQELHTHKRQQGWSRSYKCYHFK